MATWVNLMDIVYPIGAFYISNTSTSPSSTIGGIWSQITNAAIRGATSTGYTGNDSCTLTVNQIPSHKHSAANCFYRTPGSPDMSQYVFADKANLDSDTKPGTGKFQTTATGGGQSHSIVQRSYNCYVWYRTA